MKDGFEQVVLAVRELKNVLLGIPDAADAAAKAIGNIRPPSTAPVNTTLPVDPPLEFAAGTLAFNQWYRNFGQGRDVVLHGIEAVVRRDQETDFARDVMTRRPSDFSNFEPFPRATLDEGALRTIATPQAQARETVIVREPTIQQYPVLMVNGFGLSLEETLEAGERRFAQIAMQGNHGGSATSPGMRDVFDDRIREIVRQELNRG
jgi:hypothetical protein